MNRDSRKMISLIWFMIQHWIFTRFPNILTRKPVNSGVSWKIQEFVTDYSRTLKSESVSAGIPGMVGFRRLCGLGSA